MADGVVRNVETATVDAQGFVVAIVTNVQRSADSPSDAQRSIFAHDVEANVASHPYFPDMAQDDINNVSGFEIILFQVGDSFSTFLSLLRFFGQRLRSDCLCFHFRMRSRATFVSGGMPGCLGLPDFPDVRAHRVKGGRRVCGERRGGARRAGFVASTLTECGTIEKRRGQVLPSADALKFFVFSVHKNSTFSNAKGAWTAAGGGTWENRATVFHSTPTHPCSGLRPPLFLLPVSAPMITRVSRCRAAERRDAVARRDFVWVAFEKLQCVLRGNAGKLHHRSAPILK